MAKPYSKSAKSNMAGFGSDLGSSIAQGVNLETMKYQQQAALPNQHENDAQLFSGLSKAFSAPGDRPRGFWRNLGAGAMEGLEYGARSNSIAERKENYGKYADEMNWFQQVNNALIDRNERAAEAEEEMAQIRPYATAGLEISYSGMPYEQGNQNMRALVDQLKINNPKFRGDYVGYVPNSPIVNIRDENGNINAVSLSSFTGEDIVKRVQDNYIERQKIAQTGTELQLKYPNAGGSNSYGSIPITSIGGKGLNPFMQTINSEMNLAKDVPVILHQLDEAVKIMEGNPQLGTAWANVAGKDDFLKAAMLPEETREDFEKVNKIAKRVAEAYIKAKQGAISDSERDVIKEGLFTVTNSKGGNKYNIDSVRQELKIAEERGNFAAQELAQGRIATPQSFNNFRKSTGGQAMDTTSNADDSNLWNSLGTEIR